MENREEKGLELIRREMQLSHAAHILNLSQSTNQTMEGMLQQLVLDAMVKMQEEDVKTFTQPEPPEPEPHEVFPDRPLLVREEVNHIDSDSEIDTDEAFHSVLSGTEWVVRDQSFNDDEDKN